jgi:hypothetical protein
MVDDIVMRPPPLFFGFMNCLPLQLVFLLLCSKALGQTYYHDYVALGERSLQSEDFRSAVIHYEQAFKRFVGYPEDRVAYACALKSLGHEAESVEQLLLAIDSLHMHDYQSALNHACFQEWSHPDVLLRFKLAADSALAVHLRTLNTQYRDQLLEMFIVDQGIRGCINQLETSEQVADSVMSKVWQAFHPIDSLNTVRLTRLIAAHGFPDVDVVGPDANKAAWLIIQHSDLRAKEAFLPMLKASCDRGQTPMKYYAYAHDRLKNQKGITETRFLCSGRLEADGVIYFRAENPSCLNLWRESVGLPPDDSFRAYEPCITD